MIKAAIVDDDLEFLEMMSGELEKTQLFGEIKTYNDPQKLMPHSVKLLLMFYSWTLKCRILMVFLWRKLCGNSQFPP